MNRLTFFLLLIVSTSGVNCGLGDLWGLCNFPHNFESSLQVVDTYIDIQKLSGKWYEIARKPNPFQKRCLCSTGEYIPQNRTFFGQTYTGLRNNCTTKEGVDNKAYGWLFHRNEQRTKLGIQFSALMPEGNYWYLDIDKDYQWSVIAEPCRKYAWILSRNATVTDVFLSEKMAFLRSRGIGTDNMVLRSLTCNDTATVIESAS